MLIFLTMIKKWEMMSKTPISISKLHGKILDWYEIRKILMKVFQLGCIDSNFLILSALCELDWTVLNFPAWSINELGILGEILVGIER